MKKFFILCLLIPFLTYAQIQSGIVTYGLVIGQDNTFQRSERLKLFDAQATANAKYLTFTLSFNRDVALFEINDVMEQEGNGIFHAKISSLYTGKVFYEGQDIYTLSVTDFGKYYIKNHANRNWKILSETKTIDGFVCYKATSEYIVVNPKGTFKFPVIAWFCPKIPIPFGPNGYGGLPGLILELQQRNVVYGVKELKFNPQTAPVIARDPKVNLISQEELNGKIEKKMDELREETRMRQEDEKQKDRGASEKER